MGRIKTKLTKRLTYQLLAQHKENLFGTFQENKQVLTTELTGASKKVRNVVAGFVTRKMRRNEQ